MIEATSLKLPGFWQISSGTTIGLTIIYPIFAGITWMTACLLFRNSWVHRKIIAKFPSRAGSVEFTSRPLNAVLQVPTAP